MLKKEAKERILSDTQKIIIPDMMKKVNQYILKAKHIFIELYLFIFLDIKTDFNHAKPI